MKCVVLKREKKLIMKHYCTTFRIKVWSHIQIPLHNRSLIFHHVFMTLINSLNYLLFVPAAKYEQISNFFFNIYAIMQEIMSLRLQEQRLPGPVNEANSALQTHQPIGNPDRNAASICKAWMTCTLAWVDDKDEEIHNDGSKSVLY